MKAGVEQDRPYLREYSSDWWIEMLVELALIDELMEKMK